MVSLNSKEPDAYRIKKGKGDVKSSIWRDGTTRIHRMELKTPHPFGIRVRIRARTDAILEEFCYREDVTGNIRYLNIRSDSARRI
jgi:hypothetical protein